MQTASRQGVPARSRHDEAVKPEPTRGAVVLERCGSVAADLVGRERAPIQEVRAHEQPAKLVRVAVADKFNFVPLDALIVSVNMTEPYSYAPMSGAAPAGRGRPR